MLPSEAIQEFKKLYRKRYGIQLTDAEAVFRANNLVNLYTAVYRAPQVPVVPARTNPPAMPV